MPASETPEVAPEEPESRPAPQEQDEENRWLPWNWEFEWL
jgi:hypothetical protein